MTTNAQKRAIADRLIEEAGTLVEFWEEKTALDPQLRGVSAAQAAEVIGRWMAKLPGNYWHDALKEPA